MVTGEHLTKVAENRPYSFYRLAALRPELVTEEHKKMVDGSPYGREKLQEVLSGKLTIPEK